MESTTSDRAYTTRWIGSLSLSAAVFACLVLWGGITLLLTHPSHLQASAPLTEDPLLPRPVARWEGASQARCSLADLLLLWLPIGLGALSCGTGVATLVWGRGRDPEASRRALIGLILSVVPSCTCTLWYLIFAALPLLGN